MAEPRAVLHLVARADGELADAVASLRTTATRLTRSPECFIGPASPFAAALEVHGDPDPLVSAATELADLCDPAASMAIVGTDVGFIAAPVSTPVRFQYLMRRRADFTHDAYLARYRDVHSAFGLRTPNIEGYTQLHVDLEASDRLGAATGLRAAPCDSMSELHLRSVAHFLAGILAEPHVGEEAQADEEHFVDRPRSFGFTHRVQAD